MNWKTILALAVLCVPLAYCSVQHDKELSNLKIACLHNKGEWVVGWGGYCDFE
jgi:hypothetical protein